MSLRRYRSLLFKHSMIRISINCNTCYCCLSIKNPTPCLCHASVPFIWDLRPLYAYIPYKLFNMLHFYLFTSSFAFLLKREKKKASKHSSKQQNGERRKKNFMSPYLFRSVNLFFDIEFQYCSLSLTKKYHATAWYCSDILWYYIVINDFICCQIK